VIKTDVLIVGGGPAGSACAWRLKQANLGCIILDQARFPRFKPCAGWITPEILQALQLDPADYPHDLTTFTSFDISIRGVRFRLPVKQHAIRRFEFDDFLLQRAGVEVHQHAVKSITRVNGAYVVDGLYSSAFLVGAGGTHCPVYRTFFQSAGPRDPSSLIAAMEEEFPYEGSDGRCRLWFFEHDLPGYAWVVPKANGYLNVGIGGKAGQLKAGSLSLREHWNRLVEQLERAGLVRGHTYKPSGHSYYLRQAHPLLKMDRAYIVGDAAGLATLDMGEGINPAVRSGLLAAEAILKNGDYSLKSIPKYSLVSMLRSSFSRKTRAVGSAPGKQGGKNAD